MSAPVLALILPLGSSLCRVSGLTLLSNALPLQFRRQIEELEQACSTSVCLSVCVQRAALKAPTPGGRTLSLQRFVPFRCGLLPRGKLVSPSTNLFHSPWEWAATAHPPGKHVPHPADMGELVNGHRISLRRRRQRQCPRLPPGRARRRPGARHRRPRPPRPAPPSNGQGRHGAVHLSHRAHGQRAPGGQPGADLAAVLGPGHLGRGRPAAAGARPPVTVGHLKVGERDAFVALNLSADDVTVDLASDGRSIPRPPVPASPPWPWRPTRSPCSTWTAPAAKPFRAPGP